ncbi:MAG: recombinase family protein, partial [Chloroflexota bacterium]
MSKKKYSERTIALCYVRLSFTRDEDDKNSVERQRANIQTVCDEKGWTPEWFEDADGHKSGRSEKNRPAWLRLKRRLKDADVVALVANDLSRLHRRGWRIGSLIEELDRLGIALKLASPGRQDIDTTTVQGRMLVQMGAMFDEYYAEDIAQRARDSIEYRKSRGITVGMPPFGTVRDEDGYLMPDESGAWYLPDGTFIKGDKDISPANGAIWRSYFDCAKYILETYALDEMGLNKIAYKLTEEGWCFRDRKQVPRPITGDDIRHACNIVAADQLSTLL